MKNINPLIFALAAYLIPQIPAMAQTELSKVELKAQAVDMCFAAAEKRYGDDAVRSGMEKAKYARDTSRAKWSRSLKGMTVKMTIKPEAKRLSVVQCLVKTDKTVTFFKV